VLLFPRGLCRDPALRGGAAIEVIPSSSAGPLARRDRGHAGNHQYRLNDLDDRSPYTSAQGYHDNVMNPVLESTYGFIERVVGDLVAIHREAGVPLRHIHMGGDEVRPVSGKVRRRCRRT